MNWLLSFGNIIIISVFLAVILRDVWRSTYVIVDQATRRQSRETPVHGVMLTLCGVTTVSVEVGFLTLAKYHVVLFDSRDARSVFVSHALDLGSP